MRKDCTVVVGMGMNVFNSSLRVYLISTVWKKETYT